jgi:hypothetical protein
MRVASSWTLTLLLVLLFEVARAGTGTGCPPQRQSKIDNLSAVFLALVLESTFPGVPATADKKSSYARALLNATATVIVLKSWKGRYELGKHVRVAQPQIMAGCCMRYSLPVGKQFLIYAGAESEPIEVTEATAVDLADAACEIAELDSYFENRSH